MPEETTTQSKPTLELLQNRVANLRMDLDALNREIVNISNNASPAERSLNQAYVRISEARHWLARALGDLQFNLPSSHEHNADDERLPVGPVRKTVPGETGGGEGA